MRTPLRIATRASRLALWQSRHVAERLVALHPDLEVELLELTTSGDRILDRPLAKIGGKGLFIKELETALFDGDADVAVHSVKDVPADLPAGLHMPVILAREAAGDVLVTRSGTRFAELPSGSRVGTSSLRRASQLLNLRPDVTIEDLRGNVPTRLGKLSDGRYDAIVLAAAGLIRLGLYDARCQPFTTDELLPAVGQGAIGIECRSGDADVENLVAGLNDAVTARCVAAERAMNARLGGSCEVPVAGHARIADGRLAITGLVAAVDGSEIVRHTASGPELEAVQIGSDLGQAMLAAGADRILAAIGH